MAAPFRTRMSPGAAAGCSILEDRGIDLTAPGEDAAGHVQHAGESVVAEKVGGLSATGPHFAVDYDGTRPVELVESPGQLAEWDQARLWDMADLVLMRLPPATPPGRPGPVEAVV